MFKLRRRPNVVISTLGLLGAGVLISFYIGPRRIQQAVEHQFGYVPLAVYGRASFGGYDKIRNVYFNRESSTKETLYINISDRYICAIDDLKEDAISPFFGNAVTTLKGSYSYYGEFGTHFVYRDGKLISARIGQSSGKFKIGPTKDGPFVALPIDHETMIKLFGKPDRWERDYIEGGV